MFGLGTRRLTGSAIAAAAGLTLLAAGAANASGFDNLPIFAPNYTFGDGAMGWKLASHGGPINPGVLVGFNPQPDPPGDGDHGALIALLNPADPELISPAIGSDFSFRLLFADFGDGSVLPLPDPPGDGHATGFRSRIDGHDVDVTLSFGPGVVDPATWASFNPQPEPPGDFVGGQFSFGAVGDPQMFFTITIDGAALDFSLDNSGAPEPQSWALMLLGFGGLGAALRARRRVAAA